LQGSFTQEPKEPYNKMTLLNCVRHDNSGGPTSLCHSVSCMNGAGSLLQENPLFAGLFLYKRHVRAAYKSMHSVSYMNGAGSLLEENTLFAGLFCSKDK